MAEFEVEKMRRYARLSHVFTPGAPVANRDRFAGRIEQVMQVVSAIGQPGAHVVLYGERGVGKTSLANVLSEFLSDISIRSKVVRVNCGTNDTFSTVWTKVYQELGLEVPDAWAYAAPNPDQIRQGLGAFSPSAVVILDEYDRIEDDDGLSLMSDVIKALSDHAVLTKLIIVGVADSIDQLVGEHESVQRALIEVQMPRMTQEDLSAIIDNGLREVGMTIEPAARETVARLAEGLPFFVHQLMLIAGQKTVMDDRLEVNAGDISGAIHTAVERHTLKKEYQTAIQSSRPDNLYARVLIACALAEKNALGYFTASAVREPMSRIMGRPYEIPAFARHLNAFTEIDRGPVLARSGIERRYVYRFRNPMLQPFALLTAIAEDALPEELRKELLGE